MKVVEGQALDIKKFPPGLTGTPKGNTGLDEGFIHAYSLGWVPEPGNTTPKVLDYLASLDYGVYELPIWDCEDLAFWGVAHVRHRFPGCPIGIASGTAYRENQWVGHAVIILWDTDDKGNISKSSKYYFFDPDRIKSGNPILKEGTEFKMELVVPFPMGQTYSPQTIPPLDKSEFNKPLINYYFIWDKNHDWDIKAEDVFAYIAKNESKDILERYTQGCPEYANPQKQSETHRVPDMAVMKTYWQRDVDRALWAFAHARREFKGGPIGFAFGKNSLSQNDAVIIAWKNANEYTYYHPKNGKITEAEFKPNVVWV
jgi:hypothetical protein